MAAAAPVLGPVLGAATGALLSRRGGGGSTTSVERADPWEGVQPALRDLYSQAHANYYSPAPQFFPNSTVAPQSDATQLAQNRLFNRATTPNFMLRSGQQQAQSTLRGDYFNNPASQGLSDFLASDFTPHEGLFATAGGAGLNANPYVDDMFNRAAGAVGEQFSKNVMPGVASMFAGAGRFGSNQMSEGISQAQGRYGDVLSKLATDIYGGNFARERELQQNAQDTLGRFGLAGRAQELGALGELGGMFGRERLLQTQMAGQAPQLANADYFDIAQLATLGESRDAFRQRQIDADRERWDYNQQIPRDRLQFLHSILTGAPGGTTTSTGNQNVRGNPLMGALGGMFLGDRMGSLFRSQPAPVSGFNNGIFGAGINPYSDEFMGSLEF